MQTNEKLVTVVIADNGTTSRFGMKKMLSSKNSGISVIGEVENGLKLMSLLLLLNPKPDIILMDVSMPAMDGLTALKEIKDAYPSVKVIMVFDTKDNIEIGKKAMKAGANSCIKKHYSGEQVVKAILDVSRESFHSNDFIDELSTSLVRRMQSGKDKSVLLSLTDKEKTILTLMSEEKSTKEIASIVDLSPRTVEAIRDKLKTKTGTTNMAGLVMFAIKNGLTEIKQLV